MRTVAEYPTVKPSSSNRLLRSCTSTLKWPLVGVVLPRLLQLALTICQPLVLNRFLAFLEDRGESIDHGYGLIGACGLVCLGIALSGAFYSHQATRTVTMLRGILVSAIFARSTDLSTTAVDNAAAGALVQRVVREDFAPHTHRLETVVGFDRVVVLEKGCVAEEGCPRGAACPGWGQPVQGAVGCESAGWAVITYMVCLFAFSCGMSDVSESRTSRRFGLIRSVPLVDPALADAVEQVQSHYSIFCLVNLPFFFPPSSSSDTMTWPSFWSCQPGAAQPLTSFPPSGLVSLELMLGHCLSMLVRCDQTSGRCLFLNRYGPGPRRVDQLSTACGPFCSSRVRFSSRVVVSSNLQ